MDESTKREKDGLMNKYLLVLLLVPALAATGFAQGQTNARAQAYYHFSKGRLLDDQGQANQAIDEYKKALDIDPNNSLIYSEMAETYLRNNRAQNAVDAANKAIQLDRDNIEAHKLLSQVYLQIISRANAQQPPREDTVNNAVHEFEEIVRIDPTDQTANVMLARLYSIKGDRTKAAQIYKQILGREPTPEFAVQVAEECERLLRCLGEESLRSVALKRMEGYSDEEIATQLGCARRTVVRKLRRIRSLWSQEILSNAEDVAP